MKRLLALLILLTFVAIGSLKLSTAKTAKKVVKIGDKDKDGIPNAIDEDIDGDGVPNIIETQHGTDPYNPMQYLIEDTLIGGG